MPDERPPCSSLTLDDDFNVTPDLAEPFAILLSDEMKNAAALHRVGGEPAPPGPRSLLHLGRTDAGARTAPVGMVQ